MKYTPKELGNKKYLQHKEVVDAVIENIVFEGYSVRYNLLELCKEAKVSDKSLESLKDPQAISLILEKVQNWFNKHWGSRWLITGSHAHTKTSWFGLKQTHIDAHITIQYIQINNDYGM